MLSQGRDGPLADCRLHCQLNAPQASRNTYADPINLIRCRADGTLCSANFSLAQTPPSGQQMQAPQFAPAKPYKKVAATLPPPVNEPGLDTLRKQMGEIAQRKERAALAPLIVAGDSSGSASPANGADEKKSFG